MKYVAYWQSIECTRDVGIAHTVEEALHIARQFMPNRNYTAGARRQGTPKPIRIHAVVSRPRWQRT